MKQQIIIDQKDCTECDKLRKHLFQNARQSEETIKRLQKLIDKHEKWWKIQKAWNDRQAKKQSKRGGNERD